MSAAQEAALAAHLASGASTVCHVWAITRRDGGFLGFTDHDTDLSFDGMDFRAGTGLSAMALQQGTGLAVDNTTAMGLLSDASITEADIAAGRFDGAQVRGWLVNWADPQARSMVFRGTIGEIRHRGEGFEAELRGLTEALNRPFGRAYHTACPAVLGDASCQFDTAAPGYFAERALISADGPLVFSAVSLADFAPGWFAAGTIRVLSGAGAGTLRAVKTDRIEAQGRCLELWDPAPPGLASGDLLRIEAGCDKRFATCRDKFLNQMNFRGFPDIPGDDWMMARPRAEGGNTGGSLR